MGLLPAGVCCIKNDGTIIEGKFFMEPAGFTGLRHLAFENGIEYWYQ